MAEGTFKPIVDEPNLKCLECNHFKANIYMIENHTAYPNCGDQTCVSAFYWDHQMALREMERQVYEDYIPTSKKGVEL